MTRQADLDQRRARRGRAVQPGDRARRPRVLRGPGSASTPRPEDLVEGGVEAQAERTLRNLGAVLDAAGVGMRDVVKTTVFLADMDDFAAMNAVYAKFFPTRRPARSTVAVGAAAQGLQGRDRGDRLSPAARRRGRPLTIATGRAFRGLHPREVLSALAAGLRRALRGPIRRWVPPRR